MTINSSDIFAAYKLDDASGAFVDATGNGHDLTRFNSLGTTAAKHGDGLDFPVGNTTEYAAITVDSSSPFVRDFSAESFSYWFWFNIGTSHTTNLLYTSTYGGLGGLRNYRIYTSGVGSLTFESTTPIASNTHTASNVYELNEDTLAVFTVDHTTGQTTSYIHGATNGRRKVTNTRSYNTWTKGGGTIFVGQNILVNTWIDSLCFSSQALTDTEEDELWNSGSGLDIDTLLGSASGSTPILGRLGNPSGVRRLPCQLNQRDYRGRNSG